MMRPAFLRRLVCAAVLLASIAAFYPSIVALQGGFLTGDHREQHYPWAHFLDARLAESSLPWWTWKIHCGFPLLAEGQIAPFYPPNCLLHFFLPPQAAYSLNFVLHIFLSGFFFLLYCRGNGWSWPSAAVACLAYLYGNAFGGAFYNITSLKTLAWFPLTLFLIDRIWAERGRSAVNGALLGVAFGLQLLAGYLQIAVYAIGMSMGYFMLRWLFCKTLRGGAAKELFCPTLGVGKTLAVCFSITGLLFLPQFLATYPLSQMSGRVGLTEEFAYLGSFPPWGIVTLLFPKLEGLLRTTGLYVGILPLFLALLALLDWRQPATRCWGLLLALSLLIAMGGYSPLYVGVVKLTHFYGFRVPSKLLFFANTALAVLAALGMEALLHGRVSDKIWRVARGLFIAAGIVAVMVAVAGRPLLDAMREPVLQWGYDWVEKNLVGKPYHPHGPEYYRASVKSYYEMARELLWVGDRRLAISAAFLGLAIAAVMAMKRTWRRRVLAACCIGLTATDLYAYHFINKLSGDISTYAKQMAVPPSADFLSKDTSLHRIFGYRGRFEEISLIPSFNMLFGIEDVGAYSPFAMKRYRDLLEGLGAVDDSTGRLVQGPGEMMQKLPLLSLLNVKYILTPRRTVLPELAEVFSTPTEHIYANPHVQERFFFARAVHVARDDATILAALRATDFSRLRDVWLERATDPLPGLSAAGDTVTVQAYGEDVIVLETQAESDRLLFASLTYYPGITAKVDGKEARLYRANYCFCALRVPAGRHRLEFSFDWKRSLGFPGGSES